MTTVNMSPDTSFAALEGPSRGPRISIQAQTIAGNARVHNGDVYITRRSSTSNKNRQEIFRWLSPLSFHSSHQRIQDGARILEQSDGSRGDIYSGKWLLESDTLDSWRSRKIRKLWYLGMPGAGKSVLASIIISQLLELRQALGLGKCLRVAYLYLSYKESQPLEHLLGSVVKQLVGEQIPLPQALLDLWNTRNRGDDNATCADLSRLIGSLVQEHPSYIVVDALDECPHRDRLRLMHELQPTSDNLSILVTSRYLDEFQDATKGFKLLNIRADPSDLDLFIDHEFNSTSRLQKYSQIDPSLQDQVKAAVKNACDGMFLLASLHMQSIAAELNPAAVRERLTRLPRAIDDMYGDTIERIKAMHLNKAKLAFDTLSWIAFSHRPLNIGELQHALAVVPDDMNFDFERIYLEDDIRDVCGGLVTVTNGVVALVHYTAQAYFDQVRHSLFPRFQFTIAQTCIAYLSLTVLEQPDDTENEISYADDIYHEPDSRPPQQIIQSQSSSAPIHPERLSYQNKCAKFPFLLYAGEFLGRHLRQLTYTPDYSLSILQPLLKLLRERPKQNFLIRVMSQYISMTCSLPSLSQTGSSEPSWQPYRMSSHAWDSLSEESSDIDIDGLLQHILEDSDLGSSSSGGDSSATSFRPVSPVLGKFALLEPSNVSCDTYSEDDDHPPEETSEVDSDIGSVERDSIRSPLLPGRVTPLHLAAFLGWPALVGHLTEPSSGDSSNLNVVDTYGRTPLMIAVSEGHWGFISALLEHGATLDLQSREGHSVLLYMAERDQRGVILKMITDAIEHLALVPATSNVLGNLTPVSKIRKGARKMLKRLVKFFRLSDRKVPPDSKPSSHHLELIMAATTGDHLSIRRLVQEGYVDFENTSSLFHTTCLFLAVEFNYLSSVKEILASGANINMRGLRNSTPLHRASFRNSVEMVTLLLEWKPIVDLKDDEGATPWSLKVDNERRLVLDLLRRAGADPNTKERWGESKLYSAAAGGNLDEVLILLESGVDPSIRTDFDWTPLHWAASNGFPEVVNALLKAGANVNAISDQSKTPLDMSQQSNRTEISRVLVEAGAKTAREVLAQKQAQSSQIFAEKHVKVAQNLVNRVEADSSDHSEKEKRRVYRAVIQWLDDDDTLAVLEDNSKRIANDLLMTAYRKVQSEELHQT